MDQEAVRYIINSGRLLFFFIHARAFYLPPLASIIIYTNAGCEPYGRLRLRGNPETCLLVSL